MANHVSAAKRARIAERRRSRNRQGMSALRTALRKYREAVASVAAGKALETPLPELLRQTQSILARSAKKGVVHPRNASRRIGRITKAFRSVGAGAGTNASAPAKTHKPKAAKAKPAAKRAAAKSKPKSTSLPKPKAK